MSTRCHLSTWALGLAALIAAAPLPSALAWAPAARLEGKATIEPAKAAPGAAVELRLELEVDKTWHIYDPGFEGTGIPTTISLAGAETAALESAGALRFPKPIAKKDEVLGETFLYHEGRFQASWPLKVKAGAALGKSEIGFTIRYQACSDAGVCELPTELALSASFEVVAAAPEEVSLLLFLLSAAGWALFTLLMPCTYPMIPITISYFTKQAEKRGAGVLSLALLYGAGIVLDFVLIGALVGPVIVAFAQWTWFNGFLGLIFLAFALSLFGLFELRLPSFLLSASGQASQRGGYAGVFFLGATLVVTSFTCTAPFVGALLGQGAGAGHSLGRIVLGMAVFGAVMAAPFVALAMFPSAAKSLPRSGEWMSTLKVTFGFVEVAAALKFFSNVDLALDGQADALSRELFLMLWAAIALVTGLFLLGLVPLKDERPRKIGPVQLAVALAVFLFAGYCFYGAQGRPLDWIMTAIAPPALAEELGAAPAGAQPKGRPSGLGTRRPSWSIVRDDFEAGLAKARDEGKLALINWTGVT